MTINNNSNIESILAELSNLKTNDKSMHSNTLKVFINIRAKDVKSFSAVDLASVCNCRMKDDEIASSCEWISNFIKEKVSIKTTLSYCDMTDEDLLAELKDPLTDEDTNRISSMSEGLHAKIELLFDLKRAMSEHMSDYRDDVLESKLALALAVTKSKHNKSLETDSDGKLLCRHELFSDSQIDSEDFKFMASFNMREQSVEQMEMKMALNELKTCWEAGLIPKPEKLLIREVKSRIRGLKKLDSSDVSCFTAPTV